MPTSDQWDQLDDAAIALHTALELVDTLGKNDKAVAKVLLDNEAGLYALVNHVISESSEAARVSSSLTPEKK